MSPLGKTLQSERSNEGNVLSDNSGKICIILAISIASAMANYRHGFENILTAGLKQFAYSSLSGLILINLYNKLAARYKDFPEELLAVIIPTLTTILANLTIHSLKGTAEPLLSTLPTATLAIIGFPVWHIRAKFLELAKDIDGVFDDIKFD